MAVQLPVVSVKSSVRITNARGTAIVIVIARKNVDESTNVKTDTTEIVTETMSTDIRQRGITLKILTMKEGETIASMGEKGTKTGTGTTATETGTGTGMDTDHDMDESMRERGTGAKGEEKKGGRRNTKIEKIQDTRSHMKGALVSRREREVCSMGRIDPKRCVHTL